MTELHPVLLDQLNRAVEPVNTKSKTTTRDARLPNVPNKIHAVIGMRRAGKTTYLKQLQAERRESLPPERAIYLSFEDERLAELGTEQLGLLLEEYYRRYPDLRNRESVTWYLDEVQLVDGWDRFVRRVSDSERVEFVVSGSSAKLLSREVHTSLRGRSMETVIRPFSFREALRFRDEEPHDAPRQWTPALRSRIEERFARYLRSGGFPEAQGLEASVRIRLLQGYVNDVLFRDVVERYDVSQVAALRWLVRFLLRNPAGKMSVRRLNDDLRSQGHAVSRDTASTLLEYVIDAFLIELVALASESERVRNSNPRVVYPVDTGLIKAFDSSGRGNRGHALETVVHNELARRGAEVTYYKSSAGHEVDFLARDHDGNAELIQVCADLSNPMTLEREVRGLREARQDHVAAQLTLLVTNLDSVVGVDAPGVRVLPAYEWLLGG